MNAAILTIGDELLNGQTIDTNAAWMGQELNLIGVSIASKLSVGDEAQAIKDGLDYCFKHASLVIVTGGLGPTKDDITKGCLANYFEDELTFDQGSYDKIKEYFSRTNRQPTEAHKLQCHMPSKAELIDNQRGTAPGMWFAEGDKFLLSMPGVPSEMKGLMKNGGLSKIDAVNTQQNIYHYIIQTAGMGETYIAEQIEDIVSTFPDFLSIAYLPGLASVKLRLTAKGADAAQIKKETEALGARIVSTLGDAVFALGNSKLEEVVGQIAKEKGLTLGTAESCTGGNISRLLTSVSGSSAYYKGSIVAYANDVKMNDLNVSEDTINTHGAVSEETVTEMVEGLINRLHVDVAVAVSGIAGPTGGTPDKPVGTIWIAVGRKGHVVTKKLQLTKTRDLNISYTSVFALNELRRYLNGI